MKRNVNRYMSMMLSFVILSLLLLPSMAIAAVPVTAITVTSASPTMSATGQTLQMSAVVEPANATNRAVVWSIGGNSSSAGTIDPVTGVLTATTAGGTIVVHATAEDGSGVVGKGYVAVFYPVSSIVVSPSGATVLAGTPLQMTTTVLPLVAVNSAVTWTTTPGTGTGTISNTGLFTGTTAGTVNVTALAVDGSGISDTVVVTVTPANIPITGTAITNTVLEMNTLETLSMTATVTPTDATDPSIQWSVATLVGGSATIDPVTGVLSALSPGTVTVTATAKDGSNISSSVTVTIKALVSSITVTSPNSTVEMGSTEQFASAVLPLDATNSTLAWSVTNGTGSATINQSGLLTPVTVGTVTVIATSTDGSNKTSSKVITITTVPVTGVTISHGNPSDIVYIGTSLQLTANVAPINATDKSVVWYVSDSSGALGYTGTASIDSNGLLTATSAGTLGVVVQSLTNPSAKQSREFTASVLQVPVIGITLVKPTSVVLVNSTLQYNATISPTNATNKNVVWSITDASGNPTALATIDNQGLITGVAEGTVLVTATSVSDPTVKFSETVTVQKVLTTAITVGSQRATMVEGETLTFQATTYPVNATDSSKSWSVVNGTGTGTVSTTGATATLTALTAGTVAVVATANDGSGVTDQKVISITPLLVNIPVTSITVSAVTYNVYLNSTLQLNALVTPTNATNSAVVWSVVSNSGDATINPSTGLLTGTQAGTIVVKATATDNSGVSGTKVINVLTPPVVPILVTGISVVAKPETIEVGGTSQLLVTVAPMAATNNRVVWTVTNGTGTASISDSGVLTGLTVGTVTVTATAADGSNVVGSKAITIISAPQVSPVSSISISSATGDRVLLGRGLQLSAAVLPSNATNQTVTWSVYEGNATIDSGGFLTTNAVGYITVRATAQDGSDVFGSFVVTAYYASNSSSNNSAGGSSGSEPTGTMPTETKPTVTEPTAPKSPLTEKANLRDMLSRIKEAIETNKAPVKFSDTEVHWSAKDVAIFSKLGIVDGYADGSFKPNGTTTRAEFATLVVRAFSLQAGVSSGVTLKDTAGHWSIDSVQKLVSNGFVDGYADGSFKPDNAISRAEVISIVSKLIDFSKTDKVATPAFKDVDGAWNKDQILKAAESGIISGKDDSTFDPNSKSTRSEALVILLRAMELNPEIKALIDQLRSAE